MSDNKVIYQGKKGEHEIVHAGGFFFSHFGGGLQVDWGAKNLGFGSFVIQFDKERGGFFIDSEMMGKDFCAKVMEKLVQDSIFTDFEETVKSVEDLSLEQANEKIGFRPHVLYTPFYECDDKESPHLLQRRWRLGDNEVLNVWVRKEEIKEFENDSLSLDMKISEQKTLALGFEKAQLWKWKIISK